MLDPDDLPGYLHDAYGAALEHGLQSLNLTRIGGGDAKMWQASSRFARSSGYHVSIEADVFEALLGALGAWVRVDPETRRHTAIDAPLEAPMPAPEPIGLFD